VIGVLFAGAAALSMKAAMDVPAQVLLGLVLLGVGGLFARSRSESLSLRVTAAIPGAWLVIGSFEMSNSSWVRWFLVAAIVVGAALTARTEELLSGATLTPLLFALTIGGVYFAVPDTEEVLVIAGAIIPLALLGWPLGVSKIGSSGSSMAVGIMIWAAAWGGVGRPAAILGAVSCLGMFLLVPLLPRSRGHHPALIVGLHLILVAAGSRLAGQQSNPQVAALMAATALGGGYIVAQFAILGHGDQEADRALKHPR